jgi:predicted  nucleic acid-binding Zn-ribbon protein
MAPAMKDVSEVDMTQGLPNGTFVTDNANNDLLWYYNGEFHVILDLANSEPTIKMVYELRSCNDSNVTVKTGMDLSEWKGRYDFFKDTEDGVWEIVGFGEGEVQGSESVGEPVEGFDSCEEAKASLDRALVNCGDYSSIDEIEKAMVALDLDLARNEKQMVYAERRLNDAKGDAEYASLKAALIELGDARIVLENTIVELEGCTRGFATKDQATWLWATPCSGFDKFAGASDDPGKGDELPILKMQFPRRFEMGQWAGDKDSRMMYSEIYKQFGRTGVFIYEGDCYEIHSIGGEAPDGYGEANALDFAGKSFLNIVSSENCGACTGDSERAEWEEQNASQVGESRSEIDSTKAGIDKNQGDPRWAGMVQYGSMLHEMDSQIKNFHIIAQPLNIGNYSLENFDSMELFISELPSKVQSAEEAVTKQEQMMADMESAGESIIKVGLDVEFVKLQLEMIKQLAENANEYIPDPVYSFTSCDSLPFGDEAQLALLTQLQEYIQGVMGLKSNISNLVPEGPVAEHLQASINVMSELHLPKLEECMSDAQSKDVDGLKNQTEIIENQIGDLETEITDTETSKNEAEAEVKDLEDQSSAAEDAYLTARDKAQALHTESQAAFQTAHDAEVETMDGDIDTAKSAETPDDTLIKELVDTLDKIKGEFDTAQNARETAFLLSQAENESEYNTLMANIAIV